MVPLQWSSTLVVLALPALVLVSTILFGIGYAVYGDARTRDLQAPKL